MNIELASSKTALEAESAEEEEEANSAVVVAVVVAINDAAADDDSTTIAAASWSAFVLRLLPRDAPGRASCCRDRARPKSCGLGELTRRLDRAVKGVVDDEEQQEEEEVEATAILCWQPPATSRIVRKADKELDPQRDRNSGLSSAFNRENRGGKMCVWRGWGV